MIWKLPLKSGGNVESLGLWIILSSSIMIRTSFNRLFNRWISLSGSFPYKDIHKFWKLCNTNYFNNCITKKILFNFVNTTHACSGLFFTVSSHGVEYFFKWNISRNLKSHSFLCIGSRRLVPLKKQFFCDTSLVRQRNNRNFKRKHTVQIDRHMFDLSTHGKYHWRV